MREKHGTLSKLYLVMEQNALGLAICTIIDMLFVPDTAAHLATRQMVDDQDATKSNHGVGVLPLLQYGFLQALKLELQPGDEDWSSFEKCASATQDSCLGAWNSRTLKALRLASKLSGEASVEPRYMLRPWPEKLYQDLLKESRGLRVDILALWDALDKPLRDHQEGAQSKWLPEFADIQEFKRFTRKLQRAFNKVCHMVNLALRHFDEEQGERSRHVAEIHREAEGLRIPTDKDVEQLVRAVVGDPGLHQRISSNSIDRMEDQKSIRSHILSDSFCTCSVAVCVLSSCSVRLKRLHMSVVDSL